MTIQRLMTFAVAPGAHFYWSAAPGAEIIERRDGKYRKLLKIIANNTSTMVVKYVVDRMEDMSLKCSPGLELVFDKPEMQTLPDPEFDLDEIHRSHDLMEDN